MNIKKIPLDKIEQNQNSRAVYKETDLAELMASMKRDGLFHPIGVRELPGGNYDAVFGNRRIIAAKKLGWVEIDANILEVADDKERDVLNLLENIKRRNTTVAEDGRMFCVLRDYGLSPDEIAARLDVHPARVNTAIDVYMTVPKEYHAQIVNRTTGKKLVGKISASSAHRIMNIKKTHSLSKKQTKQLLEFAKTDGASLQHMDKIAPLMKTGLNVAEAINAAANMERVALFVFVDVKNAAKLEKKYGKSINKLMVDYLKTNTEFKILEPINAGKYHNLADKFGNAYKRSRLEKNR